MTMSHNWLYIAYSVLLHLARVVMVLVLRRKSGAY